MDRMEFKIKYFKDYVPFHVDDNHHPVELNPKQCPAVESEAAEVRRALAHPIGTPRLSEIVKPYGSVRSGGSGKGRGKG